MEILKLCGLKDDNKYLTKELDTWDLWDMDEDERPHELRRMCREWLDKLVKYSHVLRMMFCFTCRNVICFMIYETIFTTEWKQRKFSFKMQLFPVFCF